LVQLPLAEKLHSSRFKNSTLLCEVTRGQLNRHPRSPKHSFTWWVKIGGKLERRQPITMPYRMGNCPKLQNIL